MTYGGNSDEWAGANANLKEKGGDLRNQMELRLRFEELGEKLNAWEEDIFWKSNEAANRREEVGRILPTILEEGGGPKALSERVYHVVSHRKKNRRFREILESMGGVIFHDISIQTDGYRGMLKWEGATISSWAIWLLLYLVIYMKLVMSRKRRSGANGEM